MLLIIETHQSEYRFYTISSIIRGAMNGPISRCNYKIADKMLFVNIGCSYCNITYRWFSIRLWM